jgi:hypothetical protein
MKKSRFLLFVLTMTAVLLSACGAAAATPSVGGAAPKVDAVPVAFIGVIDSITGDQWVINGNTVTIVPDVVRDGPFNVGDQVKVEGAVNPDGSFGVSRVEPPTATDLSGLPPFGNDNSNDANTNDANVNDGNINDANVNDGNTNDDNSNAANSNEGNVNDDNGNDANSNDDNSNSANSNDDNANDDNGGGSNSNDDSGNDDNSGGGGDDSGGDDGSGGNGNDD